MKPVENTLLEDLGVCYYEGTSQVSCEDRTDLGWCSLQGFGVCSNELSDCGAREVVKGSIVCKV